MFNTINLKKILPHVIAVVVMLTASIAYFYPQLQGEVLRMEDVLLGNSAGQEVKEYKEKTGKNYLWSNGQFGGMPKMMWVPMKYNKMHNIYKAFKLGFKDPIGIFLAGMIFAYALYFFLGANPIIATALAVVTALSTSNVIIYEAGHLSKMATLTFTPLILLGAFMIFEKSKYLWGGIILTFGLAASLTQQHPQMTYYVLMFFLVFGVTYLIDAIKTDTLNDFVKSVGIGILASLLALSISSTRMLSAYDYSKKTLRGDVIIDATSADGNSVKSGESGLGWEYATRWSNDTKDIIASYLVPGYAGGGGGEKVSRSSATFKNYRMERAPLYWGGLPFTVGPMYLGVSLLFLFLLGLYNIKGKVKWWMGIGVFLLTIFSMGDHLSGINKILFDYFPMYNKFRAPQTILNVIVYFLPVLGILFLSKIQKLQLRLAKKLKKSTKAKIASEIKGINKSIYIVGGGLIALLAAFYLIAPGILSFEGASDARYAQQGVDPSILIQDRKSLLRSDSLRSLFMIALMASLIWAYINKNLNKYIVFGGLGLIVIFDLWSVSMRYVDHDNFQKKTQVTQSIQTPRPVDQQILSIEKERHRYRIQDLSINTYNVSHSSYFHNTIGGMDAAKLRRYQDLLDRHIVSQNNMSVYSMLNTKYFIVNGENGPQVQSNPQALGNAWFVDEIRWVDSPLAEIDALSSIDPATTAAVHSPEFKDLISLSPNSVTDSTATIQLIDYEPTKLTYKTSSKASQLAVFSEIWYNGNRDWKTTIDGLPANHIRANYALRAMEVPAGEHTIVFEFQPVVYAMGETVSLIGMLIFFLLIGVALYLEYQKTKLAKNEVES